MGQSLVKNYIHIIFSTKLRVPLIHQPVHDELYSYIGGICKEMECHPIKIGVTQTIFIFSACCLRKLL